MSIPENLKQYVDKLPSEPGVYFFMQGEKILYIGKATSLKDRVKSYFSDDLLLSRTPIVLKAVREADHIEFKETPSVLEALLLEANLIRKHQPPGNTQSKDDKSYNYVVFTNEEYPRVFTVRGKELQTAVDPDSLKYVFGPYISGSSLKKALSVIRKIFPFRGEKDPVVRKRMHSPLNQQIGIAPNLEIMPKKEYQRLIRNLKLFFEGKKPELIKILNREMKDCVKKLEFEEAEKIKYTIFALEHIKDTSLISNDFDRDDAENSFRIEAYDIAHMGGANMVGVMVVLDHGMPQKGSYRKFIIRSVTSRSDDTKALKEVLERRLKHDEWPLPKLIVIDGGKAQINAAQKVLDDHGYQIPLVSVVKGEGHKPKGFLGDEKHLKKHEESILLANSEAHRFAITFHRDKRSKFR